MPAHQEPWPRHQRAADRQHLLFAAGQRLGALLQPLLQAREQLEHEFQWFLAVALAAKKVTAEPQIVAH
jgi:hypothetical protein